MNSIDEYFDRKEIPRSFQTLFHGRKITGYEYSSIFTMSFTNGSPSVVSFVKEMNDLGVILFCNGKYANDYIFTKTHLFEYQAIDRWDIVNKPAKYDNSDTWVCEWGELKKIIPLSEITSIEVGEGNSFCSWKAETVQKDKNPIKGAVIGGVLAGPTGAVVGAIANAGKKDVIVMPAGHIMMNKLIIRLGVKNSSKVEMIAVDTKKSLRDKDYVIDNTSYYNRINSALSGGIRFSGPSVNNGSAAKTLTSILSKYVEEEKLKKNSFAEACNYWGSHPEEEANLNNVIRLLQKELSSNQRITNMAITKINAYVREKRTTIEEKIKQNQEALEAVGFLKKGKIKKEIIELQQELDLCVAEKKFDAEMTKKTEELNSLLAKQETIKQKLTAFKMLKTDISSPKQQEYFNIVLNPDIRPVEELLS